MAHPCPVSGRLSSCSRCGPPRFPPLASFLVFLGTTAPGCPPALRLPLPGLCWQIAASAHRSGRRSWVPPASLLSGSASPTCVCTSGQLSLLSPDSMAVPLSSGHLHLDVRGPPAQPVMNRLCQFPSDVSLLSQLLTHSRLSNRCSLTESWIPHLPPPHTNSHWAQEPGPGVPSRLCNPGSPSASRPHGGE